MRVRGRAIMAAALIALAALVAAKGAQAQLDLPPGQAPCSVLSRYPCHPAFCSVFHRGPCFPQYPLPLGEGLRTTTVSSDGSGASGAIGRTGTTAAADANQRPITTIAAMFAAVRACWMPPPKTEARQGMEYTVRFAFKRDGDLIAAPRRTYSSHGVPAKLRDIYGSAVEAAFKRCTPLHFSKQMGEAIAGQPIAIRFVDNRPTGPARQGHR